MKSKDRAMVVRAATDMDWRGNNRHKLESVKDGYKLVVDQQPEFIYNRQEEVVGVDAWVRLFRSDGKEVRIDPHRRIINPPTVPRANVTLSEDGSTREVIESPTEAFYEAIWDSVREVPNRKGWRTKGTVTTIYSETSDGRVESVGAFYQDVDAGIGNASFNVATSSVTTATGQFFSSNYSIYQQFWAFDTSAIGDSDEISDVDLKLWMVSDSSDTDFTILVCEKNWGPTLTGEDFTTGIDIADGVYPLLASLDTAGIGSSGAYKTFVSETYFLEAANMKTGTVYMFTGSSNHRDFVAPTGDEWVQFSHAETSGTTQDPKLVITHNTPAATANAPGFFTGRPYRIWRRF